MRRIKGGYELRDLSSTNGISLNEIHHKVIPLLNGLNVKVGAATFDFLLNETEIETLELEKNAEVATLLLKPTVPAFDSPLPAPIPQYATYESEESGGSSFGVILLALILITVAFFVGLHLRHQKETGKLLIESIQSKSAR